MVSPNLSRKRESGLTLNNDTKKLFQVIYTDQTKEEKKTDSPKIKVSDLISKMAFYYEKIRNTVDYEEEHLLRKNAIERILKRQIIIEGVIKISRSEELAKHLLIELIRAGYLPNDSVPETKINEVGAIIEKYLKLRNYSLARLTPTAHLKKGNVSKMTDDIKERNSLTNWLIAVAASEIEESLGRSKIKQVIVSNMYDVLSKNVILQGDSEHKNDLDIQVYLAIHRIYMRFDDDMLGLILFRYYNEVWKDPKDEDIAKISQNILKLREVVEFQLDHPLKKQLTKVVNRYNVYFSILDDVIEEDPVKVYDAIKNDPKAFPRMIKQACEKRYKQMKSKLWRVAFRSIIYIFITKSVFAVILEVPAIQFFGEELNLVSLAINVSFPAALLFLIVLLTRLPGDNNTAKIVEGVGEISFKENERTEPISLRKPAQRNKTVDAIFGILYSITFFISFGAVIWALDKINFNWVSITIFLFFLALVSFFGIKVKSKARELTVTEDKENILSFIVDFFYTPIIAVGKWLSEKFSRVNVFVFILDFIIEAPFKVFVEIAEEWTRYVRERREDIH